jgi:hypothetical protein
LSTSLADRHGVRKVSAQKTKPLRNNSLLNAKLLRNLQEDLDRAESTVIQSSGQDMGISVRGMGSRFTVTGSNFMPGTTAADIQAVLDAQEQANLVSCTVTQTSPVVVVELTFGNNNIADGVVARFDGRMVSCHWIAKLPLTVTQADGRKLRFDHKGSKILHASSPFNRSAAETKPDLFANKQESNRRHNQDNRRETRPDQHNSNTNDQRNDSQKRSFDPPTRPAAMDGPPRGPRAQLEDGRFGFRNGQPAAIKQSERGGRGRGQGARTGSGFGGRGGQGRR